MSAFLTGERLDRIPVRTAHSQVLHTVRDDDSIEAATATMQRKRVRRLPVIDSTGKLVGLLSSADIVRRAERAPKNGVSPSRVTWTLAGISEPWNPSLATVVRLPAPPEA